MSQPVNTERAAVLKQRANTEFQAGHLGRAIELYTEALEFATSSTTMELKRTILANRAQTYTDYGNIHTALRDINLALSPEYTLAASPKGLTTKCHYRRAKLLCKFAKYSEARSDFEDCERLRIGGVGITAEQSNLLVQIEEGLNAPVGSRRQQKDELLRAVDARGIIVRDNTRLNFPRPPVDSRVLNHEDQCVTFNTPDGQIDRTLANPSRTAIAIPVYIVAPLFKVRENQGREPYRTNSSEGPMSENTTVKSLLGNIFSSAAIHLTAYNGSTRDFCRKAINSSLDHDNPETSTVLLLTSRGRFFVIPRSATLGQVFAGVRWPRDSPSPFQDLRRASRVRDFEEDGVELSEGWYMNLFVLPNVERQAYLDELEEKLTAFDL